MRRDRYRYRRDRENGERRAIAWFALGTLIVAALCDWLSK